MSSVSERMQILEMIDSGVITVTEGTHLLQALSDLPIAEPEPPALPEAATAVEAPVESLPPQGSSSAEHAAAAPSSEAEAPTEAMPPPTEETPPPPSAEAEETGEALPQPPSFTHWQRWWMIPLWVGVGVTILGGLLMFWAYQTSGIGFWFGCAWLPFLLGLAGIVLAVGSRKARWLHVRVHRKGGEHPQVIAISFPIPLRLTAWGLRTFGHRIPQLEKTSADEMILALRENTSPETPFYVEVEGGEDGERVQVYVG